jgi:hypothetical protein
MLKRRGLWVGVNGEGKIKEGKEENQLNAREGTCADNCTHGRSSTVA